MLWSAPLQAAGQPMPGQDIDLMPRATAATSATAGNKAVAVPAATAPIAAGGPAASGAGRNCDRRRLDESP